MSVYQVSGKELDVFVSCQRRNAVEWWYFGVAIEPVPVAPQNSSVFNPTVVGRTVAKTHFQSLADLAPQ